MILCPILLENLDHLLLFILLDNDLLFISLHLLGQFCGLRCDLVLQSGLDFSLSRPLIFELLGHDLDFFSCLLLQLLKFLRQLLCVICQLFVLIS